MLEKVGQEAGVALPSQRRQSIEVAPQRPVTPIDEADVESDGSPGHRRRRADAPSDDDDDDDDDDDREDDISSGHDRRSSAATGSTRTSRKSQALMVRVDSDTSVGSLCR